MVRTAWRYRREYAVAQVDVYSGPSFLWAEAVCWTLRRAGKPYVLTLHGGALPEFAQRWPGRVGRLLRSAAIVTSPSPYVLQEMSVFRPDIHWVRNALNLTIYPYRLRARPKPRLVWLRAFHHLYNPLLVPPMLKLLQADFPDLQIMMIGPDKGDGSLQAVQEQAANLGVGDQLHIHGFIPKAEVPQWISQADIFLNTTNVDSAPVTVLEAMGCGLCVVSTDVGGVPYMVHHEEDALLVPPRNAEAMAQAVRRILTEPGLSERLSANARRKVEQFDWDVVLPQWDHVLEEAITRA